MSIILQDLLGVINLVLFEALPYGLIALGLVLTFRYLRIIDLTFAASFALGPAAAAWALLRGAPAVTALALAVLLTCGLGLFTIALVRWLEIDTLLAGLLASFAGFAVSLLFLGGTIRVTDAVNPIQFFREFDQSVDLGTIPLNVSQIGLFTAVLVLCKRGLDVFLRSEAGLAFRAMEDERSAPNLLPSLGIRPQRLQAVAILSGNLLCMTAGLLTVFKETQITAQRGFDAFITAIVAYLLGTTLFERRPIPARSPGFLGRIIRLLQRFSATGAAILGVLLYFAILYRALDSSAPASVPKLIVVGLIIVSIILVRWNSLLEKRAQRNDNVTLPASGDVFAARGVRVTYPSLNGPIHVLDGIDLDVAPGTLVHVVGPNGSGKTTLFGFLQGRTPGSGFVYLPSLAGPFDGRQSLVSLIGQDASRTTCATLTAEEHLALFRISGSRPNPVRPWRKRHIDTQTEQSALLTGVPGDLLVGTLSGGQRQLLSIGGLRLRPNAPALSLFDEPLTHLDEANAQGCVDLIAQMKQSGYRLVIVQHDLPQEPGEGVTARERLRKLVDRTFEIAPAIAKAGKVE